MKLNYFENKAVKYFCMYDKETFYKVNTCELLKPSLFNFICACIGYRKLIGKIKDMDIKNIEL